MTKFGTAPVQRVWYRRRGSAHQQVYVSYVHCENPYIRSAIVWDWGPDKRKAGLLFGGGDSKGARLDDGSDYSTEADRSIYARWHIFVCQVATFAGVSGGAERRAR
jgi:hypothetical protein